jgi:hypothetical protein
MNAVTAKFFCVLLVVLVGVCLVDTLAQASSLQDQQQGSVGTQLAEGQKVNASREDRLTLAKKLKKKYKSRVDIQNDNQLQDDADDDNQEVRLMRVRMRMCMCMHGCVWECVCMDVYV